MKVKFNTKELEYYFLTPLEEIKGKLPFSKDVIKQFRSLNFEALKGDRKGEYSIRLNKQYRLLVNIEKEKDGDYVIEIILLNEISKHYE